MTAPYQMSVEKNGFIEPHGFHLGTELGIALGFVYEELRKPGVRSIRLHRSTADRLDRGRIFDWRNLPENEEDHYD